MCVAQSRLGDSAAEVSNFQRRNNHALVPQRFYELHLMIVNVLAILLPPWHDHRHLTQAHRL